MRTESAAAVEDVEGEDLRLGRDAEDDPGHVGAVPVGVLHAVLGREVLGVRHAAPGGAGRGAGDPQSIPQQTIAKTRQTLSGGFFLR